MLATEQLADAREMTARFWPAHTSEVLGPDDYSLVMNRAVLGHIAVTYVRCSARVRVVPLEPSRESRVIVSLSGDVELKTDHGVFRAARERPLFHGAGWVRQFEASPSVCVMVDRQRPFRGVVACQARLQRAVARRSCPSRRDHHAGHPAIV